MTTEVENVAKPQAVPVARAKIYLRLLWLIPSAAILALGLWKYLDVPTGGTVDRIKLSTKPGPSGQASEVMRLITGTYDVYLKIKTADAFIKTQTYKNVPIGNGQTWELPRQSKLQDVKTVDVYDENMWPRSDKPLDHINLDGQWSAEGQTFRIDLQGKANEAPKWALPVLAVGATLTGLVLLRFVWDQVV